MKLLKVFSLIFTSSASSYTRLEVTSPITFSDPRYNELSWFVHITDIHISSWEDDTRQSQLQQFVEDGLSNIQPELVMCGGDLTEAKSSNLHAAQDGREWEEYHRIVSRRWSNVTWLDIRGNHDTLNVLGRNSSENYFSQHSSMGSLGYLSSYKVSLVSRGQTFNVLAIDATWDLGVNYPFNFVGQIADAEQKNLLSLVSDNKEEEVTIMFGHYPTSVVEQAGFLRDLISKGIVYLSGHLHDLALFRMHTMFSFHNDRDLELELVDWKNNRKFRILAVDQGKLSFVDVEFNEWQTQPVALVTYPKDIQFMNPAKEDFSKYQENIIKVLVFHNLPISKVLISLDGGDEIEGEAVDGGPLYILPWNTENFKTGVHTIKVRVTDFVNRKAVKYFEQKFTLDPEEAVRFNSFMPNIVLRSSFASLFHTLYGLTLTLNIMIPLGLKVILRLLQSGKLTARYRNKFQKFLSFCLVRKLMLVVSHDAILISMMLFILYMAVGPWVIGSMIEGRLGAVFAWGVVVDNTMIRSQVPFSYYFVHFGLIHPVMVLAVGHLLDVRYGQATGRFLTGMLAHVSVMASLLLMTAGSLFLSLTFWVQFGVLGIFLGPLKTWSYIFYSLMFWLAWRTKPEFLTSLHRYINGQGYKKDEDLKIEEGSITGTVTQLL